MKNTLFVEVCNLCVGKIGLFYCKNIQIGKRSTSQRKYHLQNVFQFFNIQTLYFKGSNENLLKWPKIQ